MYSVSFSFLFHYLQYILFSNHCIAISIGKRGGSRAAATSKMERFVVIFNGFQPLTIITKRSTLDIVALLDPPLGNYVIELPIKLPIALPKELPIVLSIELPKELPIELPTEYRWQR